MPRRPPKYQRVDWSGPKDAKLLFIAEAPGYEEDLRGEPLIGPTGQEVRRYVKAAGLDPENDVRYGNVYHTLPDTKGGKFWTGTERRARLLEAKVWVESQLQGCTPKVVVFLGDIALNAFTGLTKISEHSGSCLNFGWGKDHNSYWLASEVKAPNYWPEFYSVPMSMYHAIWGACIHPASVLRDPMRKLYPMMMVHLTRYAKLARETDYYTLKPLNYGGYELGRAEDAFGRLAGKTLVLDTEYDMNTHVPYMIGLMDAAHTNKVSKCYVFDLPLHSIEVNRILKTSRGIVAHNSVADIEAMKLAGLHIPPIVHDTQLTAHTLQPDLPVSLSNVGRFYLWLHPWKWMSQSELISKAAYNSQDVFITKEVYLAQLREMAQDLKVKPAVKAQHDAILTIDDMRKEGMRVSVTLLDKMRREHAKRIRRYLRYVKQATLSMVMDSTTIAKGDISANIATIREPLEHQIDTILDSRICTHTTLLKVKPKSCPVCIEAYSRVKKLRDAIKLGISDHKKMFKKIDKLSEEFDPRNPNHMRWLVYDVWGVKPNKRRRTDTGLEAMDERAIEEAMLKVSENRQRILRASLLAKQYQKSLSTFLSGEVTPDSTGHIHPKIKQHGTATGRPSSGGERDADTDADDGDTGSGFNSFNIPKQYRSIFIPRDGYVFVGGDYADLEGRLVAFASGDDSLCRWYREGRDVHSERAHLAYPHIPADKRLAEAAIVYKSGKRELTARFIGKKAGHGTHYGMGVARLADELHVPMTEAIRVYDAIYATHKPIKHWQHNTELEVWGMVGDGPFQKRGTHVLHTVWGRRRYFFGTNKQCVDKALAFVPQSCGSSIWYRLIANITMDDSSKLRHPWDGRVVTGTYDSVLCEVRVDQADEFAKWLSKVAAVLQPELYATLGAGKLTPSFPFEVKIGWTYKEVS